MDKYFPNFCKKKCGLYIKKNGKIIINYTNYYYHYLCIAYGYTKIISLDFPFLLSKNSDILINKLLILNYIQKQNINYILIKNKITFFDDDNINNILIYYFIEHIIKIDKKIKYIINSSSLYTLAYIFYKRKLINFNMNDNEIFIEIFYENYIKSPLFQNELKERFNKKLSDFANYNELYIFLKKHKYIYNYYNKRVPRILNNYKYFEKMIIEHPNIDIFKKNYINNIKKFSSFNILKLISKKYIGNIFNIKYIKNKYLEYSDKI